MIQLLGISLHILEVIELLQKLSKNITQCQVYLLEITPFLDLMNA